MGDDWRRGAGLASASAGGALLGWTLLVAGLLDVERRLAPRPVDGFWIELVTPLTVAGTVLWALSPLLAGWIVRAAHHHGFTEPSSTTTTRWVVVGALAVGLGHGPGLTLVAEHAGSFERRAARHLARLLVGAQLAGGSLVAAVLGFQWTSGARGDGASVAIALGGVLHAAGLAGVLVLTATATGATARPLRSLGTVGCLAVAAGLLATSAAAAAASSSQPWPEAVGPGPLPTVDPFQSAPLPTAPPEPVAVNHVTYGDLFARQEGTVGTFMPVGDGFEVNVFGPDGAVLGVVQVLPPPGTSALAGPVNFGGPGADVVRMGPECAAVMAVVNIQRLEVTPDGRLVALQMDANRACSSSAWQVTVDFYVPG